MGDVMPLLPNFVGLDLWQPQRHVWIILTLQGRRILQWEISKLQASNQGKTSFEKKKYLSTLNILEILEKAEGHFNHFWISQNLRQKRKIILKKIFVVQSWLLAIGCYRLSRPVEQQSPKIFWKTRGTKCRICCHERAKDEKGSFEEWKEGEWVWARNVIEYTSRLWKRELSKTEN